MRELCTRPPWSLYQDHDDKICRAVACTGLAAHRVSFWPRTVAAMQPAGALKTPVRIPKRGIRGGDAAPVGRRCRWQACCYRYAVLTFLHAMNPDKNFEAKNYEGEARHPSTGGNDGGGGC